jgi:Gpi18-like mannosyltransferase
MKIAKSSTFADCFNMISPRNVRIECGFIFLALILVVTYPAMIRHHSADLVYFVFPWIDKIREVGIKNFLAGSDYNYTPPYIYLLYFVSILPGPEVLYVKLLSIAGTGLLCICLFRLFSIFMDGSRAWLFAAGIFVLPTVAMNSVFWGQCDAIFTAAIVLAIAEGMRNHLIRMMLAIGVAFAFKAQTVLIFPFILYFLISRRMPVWYLLIPAAVYGIFMVPAWMAGRPIAELVEIYLNQAGYYNRLSAGAPNPWAIVQDHLHGILLEVATPAGSIIGLAAGIALAFWAQKKEATQPRQLMELAVASAILIPYLLPRMHDRYFFPADVLCYAFALAYSSTWMVILAILLQLGSLCAYFLYLMGDRFRYGAHVGAVFIGLAVLLVGYQLLKNWNAGPSKQASPLTSG